MGSQTYIPPTQSQIFQGMIEKNQGKVTQGQNIPNQSQISHNKNLITHQPSQNNIISLSQTTHTMIPKNQKTSSNQYIQINPHNTQSHTILLSQNQKKMAQR